MENERTQRTNLARELQTHRCLYLIDELKLTIIRPAGIASIMSRTSNQDHANDGEITIFPLQLRDVLEVHAVDTQRSQSAPNDGEPRSVSF